MAVSAHAADPIRGAALYQTYCLDCHGAVQAPTNATVLNARSLAPVLREGIASPRSGMGFLADVLSASDIDSIVAYLGTEPGRIDFGAQPLRGTTLARSITIQAGREDLTGLRATAQGDFNIAGSTCGERLPALGRCTIDLRFAPQGVGERTGLLSINHSGVSSPVRVALDGQGQADLAVPAALLSVDPGSLDFGAIPAGQSSAESTLTLRNSGNADLTVLSAVAPIGFVVRNDCAVAVRPGDACRLGIVFRPASIGTVSGELVITSNQTGGAVRLPLSGRGANEVARLGWAGEMTRVDFAATPIGRSGAAQTLTLVNQGPGVAALEALSIIGRDAGEFTLDTGSSTGCRLPLTLPVGGQCSIAVGFEPRNAAGERSASLRVEASAQLPPELRLTGLAAPVAVAAAPTNVGAGGCTLGGGDPAFDPWWPVLIVLSIAVLALRSWQRIVAARRARGRDPGP